jgi:MtN3 and saliva related transmembrane protein
MIVVLSTIVWLVYGFAVNSGPVIVANFIVFALTLVLLYFKSLLRKAEF